MVLGGTILLAFVWAFIDKIREEKDEK